MSSHCKKWTLCIVLCELLLDIFFVLCELLPDFCVKENSDSICKKRCIKLIASMILSRSRAGVLAIRA